MQMKQKERIKIAIFSLGAGVFIMLLVGLCFLVSGGSAQSGKVEDGRFFLADSQSYLIETTPVVWYLNYGLTVVMIPAVFVSSIALCYLWVMFIKLVSRPGNS